MLSGRPVPSTIASTISGSAAAVLLCAALDPGIYADGEQLVLGGGGIGHVVPLGFPDAQIARGHGRQIRWETILADAAGITRAAQILRDGGLVAVPTETVYGLAARADSDEAVARIYEAKGRPSFNPLIVHVRDVEQARELAEFGEKAGQLASEHWPGPLTVVLSRREEAALADAVSANLATVALRCPAHPVMQAVLAGATFP